MAQPEIYQPTKADFQGVRHHDGCHSRNDRAATIRKCEAAGASKGTIDAMKALDETLRKIEDYWERNR